MDCKTIAITHLVKMLECAKKRKKMLCIKCLREKLMARNFTRQVNELHARITMLNKFTELGRPNAQVSP